jgi:hypothetical protein
VKIDTVLFTQCGPLWGFEWDMAHTILRSVVLYLIPLIFMTFAYYQIVRVLWSSANIPGDPSGRRHTTTTLVMNGTGNGSSHNHVQCQAQRESCLSVVCRNLQTFSLIAFLVRNLNVSKSRKLVRVLHHCYDLVSYYSIGLKGCT